MFSYLALCLAAYLFQLATPAPAPCDLPPPPSYNIWDTDSRSPCDPPQQPAPAPCPCAAAPTTTKEPCPTITTTKPCPTTTTTRPCPPTTTTKPCPPTTTTRPCPPPTNPCPCAQAAPSPCPQAASNPCAQQADPCGGGRQNQNAVGDAANFGFTPLSGNCIGQVISTSAYKLFPECAQECNSDSKCIGFLYNDGTNSGITFCQLTAACTPSDKPVDGIFYKKMY